MTLCWITDVSLSVRFLLSADSQTVRYYLADDTVDVNESNQVNSGRDSLTTLLKRNKLPKDFTHCVASVAAIGRMNQTGVENYTMVRVVFTRATVAVP